MLEIPFSGIDKLKPFSVGGSIQYLEIKREKVTISIDILKKFDIMVNLIY